jgi:tRNA threonylcarbamoyladenosine biosynthesis protein TsaB
MPTILALETSTELASVALLHGERVLTREAAGPQTHSQTVLPMVQSVLQQAGLTLAQCDAVAFGSGPGSFTGVRTACGIAQGLAFGLGKPALPVVTLLAMAQACREARGADSVLCVLDARMGEVYWAQYRFDGGWHCVGEPALAAPEAVAPQGAFLACGNGLLAYPALPGAHDGWGECQPHAAQVAQLARFDLARGGALPAREAQPLYLRNKVAFTTGERLARGRA